MSQIQTSLSVSCRHPIRKWAATGRSAPTRWRTSVASAAETTLTAAPSKEPSPGRQRNPVRTLATPPRHQQTLHSGALPWHPTRWFGSRWLIWFPCTPPVTSCQVTLAWHRTRAKIGRVNLGLCHWTGSVLDADDSQLSARLIWDHKKPEGGRVCIFIPANGLHVFATPRLCECSAHTFQKQWM